MNVDKILSIVKKVRFCIFLLALLTLNVSALEPVTLQLKYIHQFQFAGYYAAEEQGYYRDAGLDVTIQEGQSGDEPLNKVSNGEAQFGVSSSSLLLAHQAGHPVVVLSVIFQHTPLVLLTPANNVQSLQAIKGKRVMIAPQAEDLVALLRKKGVQLNDVVQLPHSFNPDDLIENRVDIFSAYITNEPDYLDQQSYAYDVYSPRSDGIDFYGDNLFTSESEIIDHPERVEAFRKASLRGWQYALDNPQEIVDLILNKYSQKNTRDHLLYESEQMIRLIKPVLVEIGYMSPVRWRRIADTYSQLGMLPKDYDFDGMISYRTPQNTIHWWYYALIVLFLILLFISGFYLLRLMLERNRAREAMSFKNTMLLTQQEASIDGLIAFNIDGSVSSANKRFYNLWQLDKSIAKSPTGMLKYLMLKLSNPSSLAQMIKKFNLDNKLISNIEVPLKDGRIFDCYSSPMINDEGQYFGRLWSFRDITERVKTALALRLSESKLSNHLQNTPLAAISWDENFCVTQWNKAAENIFGYSVDEAIGKHPTGFIVSAEVKIETDQVMKALLENKGGVRSSNDNVTKDGRTISCEWHNTSILDDLGKVIGVASLCEDVTDRKQSEMMIWEQANYDSLTGLANRQMANDYLDQEIKIADRSNKSVALLFLDLDDFKDINDTLGHEVGDNLLIETAKRLRSYTREVDTIARFGGDEFVILMGGLYGPDSVDQIASNLLKIIAEPFNFEGEIIHTSTSIGITLYPQDASNPIEMLRNADQAMYAAKHNGGNSFQYFTPSMQQGAVSRMSLIRDLRTALPNNQFQLYYQPIVNLVTGDIHKAEALIRWQHPERGLVGPVEFIPIAEETKMIVDIGDWVFREACRQSARWRASFHPNFQISINTSPVQYKSDVFNAKDWLEHLQTRKLSGDAIAVEITEGTLMETGSSVDKILFDFRDANIQVSLDDFGTGYSSLSALKKLDIDYLKIDKSFVDNLEPSSDDLALCEAIIVMAHKLDLKVIAEGIETEPQRDLLIAAGCDYGQGYLFSKPLPAIEFEALLI
jgi:diguanylate cyclase (GGDEF)-like protein/PAS domain S-box-containing protein